MKARLIAQVECPVCGSVMSRRPERGIVCARLARPLESRPPDSCSLALSGVVFDDFVNLVPLEVPEVNAPPETPSANQHEHVWEYRGGGDHEYCSICNLQRQRGSL